MLIACTDELKYGFAESSKRNQLEFFISRYISDYSTSADLFIEEPDLNLADLPVTLSPTDREAA